MGCSQSNEANDPLPVNTYSTPARNNQSQSIQSTNKPPPPPPPTANFQITMIGNTSVQGLVLGYLASQFHPVPCRIPIPRYCHALLHDQTTGYITGGIEDLEANVNIKATLQAQILQGTISKKFIRVSMSKLQVDPAGSFEVFPDMINARYAHCAVQLQSCLYVIGGRQYGSDENGLLSACQKYDFGNQKWKSIPSLQYPRAAGIAIVYGNFIYVLGGYSGNNNRTRVIESYSDGDSSWRKLPYSLHEGFQGALAIKKPSSQSSILIFGGKTNIRKSNRVVELNFDKSTVITYTPMKQERSFHKGKILNGKAILIGGGSEHIEVYGVLQQSSSVNKQLSYLQYCTMKQLNSFSQFNEQIVLNYQKRIQEMPILDSRIYIFGHAFQPFTQIINPVNMVVSSEGQSLFHNFYQFTNVVKVNKQNCFVLGGISSDLSEVTNSVYSFNLLNNQIKQLEPMQSPRYAFGSTVLGSYLYVIGGRRLGDDDVAILNQCQRFSFQTYKWQPLPPMKYKRQSPTVVTIGDFIIVIGGYKITGTRSNQIQMYIPADKRWVQLEYKFQLSVESMTPVVFNNIIYLMGGRAESDIQKVFKLNLDYDDGVKFQKSIRAQLEPVGHLTNPGTNLKVFVNLAGIAFVFGNIPCGIDVYDFNRHKIVQSQQLPVFEKLGDPLFQSYTLIF